MAWDLAEVATLFDLFAARTLADLIGFGTRTRVAQSITSMAAGQWTPALCSAANGLGVAKYLNLFVTAIAGASDKVSARRAFIVMAIMLGLWVPTGAGQSAREEAPWGLSSAGQRRNEHVVATSALKDTRNNVRTGLTESWVATILACVSAQKLFAAHTWTFIAIGMNLASIGAA